MATRQTSKSLDDEVPRKFVMLSVSGRRETFASGDESSLRFLKRRLLRSNFAFSPDATRRRLPRPRSFSELAAGRVVVVVDAFTTGACVAADAAARGFRVAHVLSLGDDSGMDINSLIPGHLKGAIQWAAEFGVDARAPLEASAADVADDLRDWCDRDGAEVAAVVAGAETGVKLADCLSEAVARWAPAVRTNGASGAEARRNKWDMGEKVRGAGVRAVRQLRSAGWDAALERWLRDDWKVDPADDAAAVDLIVKPTESAGSDGVTGCKTVGAVRAAVGALLSAPNALGQRNEQVLIQEFLRGDEYVVDSASRDGVHKVVGMWLYDRKPTNGAGFVCHGQRFVGGGEAVVDLLAAYSTTVLDALELKHGPSHMEVKLAPGSGAPCLVEVGARCHGGEGYWMSVADECCGRNQVCAALDAYVDAAAYAKLPPRPPAALAARGRLKYLLFHKGGTLADIDAAVVDQITALPSYRGHEFFVAAGAAVVPTKDCFTWGGVVKLNGADEAQVDRDYAFLADVSARDPGLWVIA